MFLSQMEPGICSRSRSELQKKMRWSKSKGFFMSRNARLCFTMQSLTWKCLKRRDFWKLKTGLAARIAKKTAVLLQKLLTRWLRHGFWKVTGAASQLIRSNIFRKRICTSKELNLKKLFRKARLLRTFRLKLRQNIPVKTQILRSSCGIFLKHGWKMKICTSFSSEWKWKFCQFSRSWKWTESISTQTISLITRWSLKSRLRTLRKKFTGWQVTNSISHRRNSSVQSSLKKKSFRPAKKHGRATQRTLACLKNFRNLIRCRRKCLNIAQKQNFFRLISKHSRLRLILTVAFTQVSCRLERRQAGFLQKTRICRIFQYEAKKAAESERLSRQNRAKFWFRRTTRRSNL